MYFNRRKFDGYELYYRLHVRVRVHRGFLIERTQLYSDYTRLNTQQTPFYVTPRFLHSLPDANIRGTYDTGTCVRVDEMDVIKRVF